MFPDRSLLTAAKPTPPITSVIHTELASRSPCRVRVTQTKERDQGSSGLEELDSRDGIAIGGINWYLLKGPLDGGEPGARGVNLVGARHDKSAKEQWELNVVQERREQQRGKPAHFLRRGMSTAVPSLTAASHASQLDCGTLQTEQTFWSSFALFVHYVIGALISLRSICTQYRPSSLRVPR